MKRILLVLTLVGLLVPLAPRAQAATEVSVNFFYDNLSPYGSWYDVADYGYCFQPSVAAGNTDWRPYSDGYWTYTDAGWTWVSYEDFGWATYHYGRWALLADLGWVWVPGYEWGPAWVSWRTGGDYIGWAPLPPAAPAVYEGRVIGGHIDIEYDIGPTYYNFVELRYIGEPVLRRHVMPPSRNVTIINRTVNVTNITYNNSVVNVYGPDVNRINQYSTRPVQRLTLRRETQVGDDIVRGRKHANLNRVSGNELTVVAPPVQKTQQKVAPRQVKRKVEKPKIEHGWQGVANRQQLQEEMKKENAKNVPPPSRQPQKGRGGENAANLPGAAERTAAEGANAAQPTQQSVQRENYAAQQRQAEREQRQHAREERQNARQGEQAQQQNAEQSARQEGQVRRQPEKPQQQQQNEEKRRAAQQQAKESRQKRGNSARQEAEKEREHERPQRTQDEHATTAEREGSSRASEQSRQHRPQRSEAAQNHRTDQGRQRVEQQQNAQEARGARTANAQRERAAQRRSARGQQAPARAQQAQQQNRQNQRDEEENQENRKKKKPEENQPQP